MSNTTYMVISILVITLMTMTTRFLPFIFLGSRQTPKWVTYLGKVLPYSIMGMLVVFCLKSMSFAKPNYGLSEIISVAFVVVIHAWKKNTLLSIALGTVLYMVLVQAVFI